MRRRTSGSSEPEAEGKWYQAPSPFFSSQAGIEAQAGRQEEEEEAAMRIFKSGGAQVEDPGVGAPPQEELKAIQFDVLGCQELLEFSVFERDERSLARVKSLCDPRLGLPSSERKCTTCGADAPAGCEGHFGHIRLPEAIFHPLYIKTLLKVLRTLCLHCSRVRKKKKKKKKCAVSAPLPVTVPVGAGERAKKRKSGLPPPPARNNSDNNSSGSSSNTCVAKFGQSSAHPAGVPALLLQLQGQASGKSKPRRLSGQKRKPGRPAGGGGEKAARRNVATAGAGRRRRRVVEDDDEEEEEDRYGWEDGEEEEEEEEEEVGAAGMEEEEGEEACRFCTTEKREYGCPPLRLKVVSAQTRSGATVDSIEMEAGNNSMEDDIVSDYWDFVGGHPGGQTADDPQTSRTLLAGEALKLLKALPEHVMAELCRESQVLRPERFIVTCVPVPPNSSRVVALWNSKNLAPLDNDPATKVLAQLLKTIKDIRENSEKRTFSRCKEDARRLQQHYSLALKASKMKEEPEKDQEKEGLPERKGRGLSGRIWLKNNVFGKFSDFCFRGAVTGDPSIQIQEIGLNHDIARSVTVPEVVTRFNKERLQGYVNNRSSPDTKKTTRATFVWRGGDRFQLDGSLAPWELLLGDKVERYLMNGDVVIANRQPSVHKHSIIALRVVLHSCNSIGLNPLICPPFGADFDGDCFSVYAPQGLPSIVECHELMTVEQQLINPQCGQSIVSLTQDTLLGAYLITRGDVFFPKHMVGNMAVLGPGEVPVPAIVKSPRGALWTGKQVFSLTLPECLHYQGMGACIRGGQLVECQGDSKWLSGSAKGLVRAIHDQAGPASALSHLNYIQSIANWWLACRGFSVGLSDFLVAREEDRQGMLKEIKEHLEQTNKAAEQEQILADPYIQRIAIRSLNVPVDPSFTNRSSSKVKALQTLGVAKFQQGFTRIDHVLMGHMKPDNSVLAMVRAGSKGSMAKLVQQGGCLGLHLYKGEEVLPMCHGKPFSTEELGGALVSSGVSLAGHWDSRGLIWRSLVDGLRPREFFVQTMCSRSSAPSYGLELPNKIFRNLNLHMRDIFVSYDGTVRHRMGMQLLQLNYGGFRESDDPLPHASNSLPLLTAEEEGTQQRLSSSSSLSSSPVSPGEAVGSLAATSLAEPAYNFVLGSSQQAGRIDPLKVLRETFFTRNKAPMKELDRTVTLRLAQAVRNRVTGQERAALEIQEYLKTISLSLLTTRRVIEYRPTGKEQGDNLRRNTPWLGHVQLDEKGMLMCGLTLDQIVRKVEEKLSSDKKLKHYNISVVGSSPCEDSDTEHVGSGPCDDSDTEHDPPKGPVDRSSLCLHVFHEPHMSLFHDSELTDVQTTENLEKLRDELLPAILETVVIGDERIESVKIRWEDKFDWTKRGQSQRNEGSDDDQPFGYGAELVLDVVVRSSYFEGSVCRKATRGKPWGMVVQACLSVSHLVDWKRSMPASVQEVYHNFGIDAARNCILQRLTQASNAMGNTMDRRLLKLVADAMVQTGQVVGMNAPGYQEFLNCYKLTAPFTQATDQEPLRKFAQASVKGDVENLSSVVTSAVWGKHVQLGTGADMELLWKDAKLMKMKRLPFNMDVHKFMSYFTDLPVHGQTAPNTPSSVYHSMSSDATGGIDHSDLELDDDGISTLSEPSASSPEVSIHSGLPRLHCSSDPESLPARGVSMSLHHQTLPSLGISTQRSPDPVISHGRAHLSSHEPPPPGLNPSRPDASTPLTHVNSQVAPQCNTSRPEQVPDSSPPLLRRWAAEVRGLFRDGTAHRHRQFPRNESISRGTGSISQDETPEWLADVETCIREVLHQGNYGDGEKLKGLHQTKVLSALLPHHPNYMEKVRGGVKCLKYGLHLKHKSPCLFIVRNDGSQEDVSLRKCVEARIEKENPNYLATYKNRLRRGPYAG